MLGWVGVNVIAKKRLLCYAEITRVCSYIVGQPRFAISTVHLMQGSHSRS